MHEPKVFSAAVIYTRANAFLTVKHIYYDYYYYHHYYISV